MSHAAAAQRLREVERWLMSLPDDIPTPNIWTSRTSVMADFHPADDETFVRVVQAFPGEWKANDASATREGDVRIAVHRAKQPSNDVSDLLAKAGVA